MRECKLTMTIKPFVIQSPVQSDVKIRSMRSSLRKREWHVWRVAIPAVLLLAAQGSAAQVEPGNLAVRQEFLKKLVAAAVERSHHGSPL